MANLDVYLRNRAARLEEETAAAKQALAEAQAQIEQTQNAVERLRELIESAGYSVEQIDGELALIGNDDEATTDDYRDALERLGAIV